MSLTPDEFVRLTLEEIEGDEHGIGPLTARHLCELLAWYKADADRLGGLLRNQALGLTDPLMSIAEYVRARDVALAEHDAGPTQETGQ